MTANVLQNDPKVVDIDDIADHPAELLQALAEMDPDDPARLEVRDEAVRSWLPLAEHLARRFSGRGEPLEDVLQTACLGLIKAIDRFDADRGSDFVAFAVPTILGEVKRHFRDHTWDIRVPRRLQELRLAINGSLECLAQRLGRSPTTGDLADDLNVSEQEILEGVGVARVYSVMSLDAMAPSGGGTALSNLLGEEDTDLALTEFRLTLAPALAALPEREQRILLMRFYRNMTQTEIAEQIGISQMHVSRLLTRALAMLREALQEDEEDEPANAV